MNFTSIRLKLRHFFRKYKNVLLIAFIAWGIIFIINNFLVNYTPDISPNTTREPSVTVLNSGVSAPKKVHETIEKMIDEYVGYCNEGNYQKAFNMLSKDCQKYGFFDNIKTFANHVLVKIPTPKKYSIQDYSNYGKYYIYEVKYIDDILTTGLTNQNYDFSIEKFVFKKNSDGGYDMSAGNFVEHDNINKVAENDYIKIDIKEKTVLYSLEVYKVRFLNRTDSTVVVQDNIENSEVNLVLPNEVRALEQPDETIILKPGEELERELSFTKFADDGDDSVGILFSSIRVIEDYKGMDGTEEERKAEIENALAKFSMQVPVQ